MGSLVGTMRPKHWIDPSADTNVQAGDLRIVRLEDGTVRATKWVQHSGSTNGYYADVRGDGVGSVSNQVVAVAVTWQRKRVSGPSGKNTVPKRTVRIPDGTWTAAGEKARAAGADRNQVINHLLETWVRQCTEYSCF